MSAIGQSAPARRSRPRVPRLVVLSLHHGSTGSSGAPAIMTRGSGALGHIQVRHNAEVFRAIFASFFFCSMPLTLIVAHSALLQRCRIECAFTLNFFTPMRLHTNGHLEVSFCVQTFSRLQWYRCVVSLHFVFAMLQPWRSCWTMRLMR